MLFDFLKSATRLHIGTLLLIEYSVHLNLSDVNIIYTHGQIIDIFTIFRVYYPSMKNVKKEPTQRLKVIISRFAERHYIKKFQKKCGKEAWRVTQEAIIELCAGIPILIKKGNERIKLIHRGIYKVKFTVAQSKKSYKSSGDRCIVYVDEEKSCVIILLVYHKDDLPKKQRETQAWKSLVRENFPEYRDLLS